MSLDQRTSTFTGSLILPGSDDFEDARLHHGQPGDPAAVARVANTGDVVAAIAAARAEDLPVAVRGGGHSMWESVPGALVIDLHALHEVEVDGAPSTSDGTRIVHIGGGATWGQVAAELGTHGLAISSGDTRSVGVGGLTLGAGIGWVVRGWGLALDQLVGVQLVTADGEVLEVTAASHPDLFWGLRGGGGNLGVATRFDFRAHPLAGVVHASITLDGANGLPPLVRAFRDIMRRAPRELNASLVRTPAMGPEMPSRLVVEAAWAGTDEAAAGAAFAPLLALPQVAPAEVAPAAYVDLLQEPPTPPPGMQLPTIVDENGWFESLDDDVIDALLAAADAAGAQMFLVRWLGGAFGDVDSDATAIAFRNAEAFIVTAAFVPPGAPDGEAKRMKDALSPFVHHALGTYGNFTNSVAPGLSERMYPPKTLARLRALKREWDPDNTFSRNHSVVPVS
ncbi:MAG TPA: FAD-binding oxidoreductase [Propionicimonas sp.]|uniref:FAD-binding oxidoreductase n=1 Tax=Propionicimonas sp. TaxID=1955623 RepID=UPI002F41C111